MSLWLTRLTLRLSHPQVLRDLADVTQLHRSVMNLFPDELGPSPRQAAGVLFRVEDQGEGVRVLIQSALQPDLKQLPDHYADAATLKLKGLLDALTAGTHVRYRITANPSKQLPRGHTGPGRPGQRIALRGGEVDQWWETRARQAGLTLHTTTTLPQLDLTDGIRRKASMRHAAARFEGTATIHDTTALHTAVLHGIGRSKPYGCGLLSLIPLTTLPTAQPPDH